MRERKGRIKRWRQSIVVENEIRLCREIKRNVTAFPVGGTARGLPCTREGSHLLHDLREFRAELVEGPLLLEVLAALAPIVRAAVVLLTPFPAVVVGPQSPRRHAPRGPLPRDAQCPRARRSGHRFPTSLPPRPPPQRTDLHAGHAYGCLRTARSLARSLSLRAQIRPIRLHRYFFGSGANPIQKSHRKFRIPFPKSDQISSEIAKARIS